MEKDPGQRYQRASEVRAALETIRAGGTPATGHVPKSRRVVWLAAGIFLILLIMGTLAFWRSSGPSPPSRSEWVQLTNFTDSATSPALFPDGRMLTFIRGPNTFYGSGQIYVKLLPNGESVPLTRDALRKMSPVFSPDGSRIAYTTVTTGFAWDTWVGAGRRRGASALDTIAFGLVWIDSRRLLFSR